MRGKGKRRGKGGEVELLGRINGSKEWKRKEVEGHGLMKKGVRDKRPNKYKKE